MGLPHKTCMKTPIRDAITADLALIMSVIQIWTSSVIDALRLYGTARYSFEGGGGYLTTDVSGCARHLYHACDASAFARDSHNFGSLVCSWWLKGTCYIVPNRAIFSFRRTFILPPVARSMGPSRSLAGHNFFNAFTST